MAEVDILQPLGGDVLALRELEHVLDAVDDLESAARVHGRNVPRPEPPVREHGLGRLGFVAVVPAEEAGAADEELAPRLRCVRGAVFHVWDVHQADLEGWGDGAAIADAEVADVLAEAMRVGFGEAVALDEVVAERCAEEGVECGIQRSGAADHVFCVLEAEGGGDFAAPQPVVEGVGVCGSGRVGGLHSSCLCVYDVSGEGACDAGFLDCGGADGAAEAVVEAGNRGEGGGFQSLDIVHQGEDIAFEIAHAAASPEGAVFDHAAVDVREGEVGKS